MKVDIYIETSSQFQGKVERKCGYVLSTLLRGGEETRKHFGTVSGTYHQAVLLTIADALAPGLQQGAYSAIPSNLIPNNCSDCVDPVHILQRSDVHRF